MKNLEIEKSVLSMLMMNSDLMLENEVNEADFTTPIHKKIFATIQEYGSNYPMIQGRFQEEDLDYVAMIASLAIGDWRRKADHQELKRLTEMRRIYTITRGIQIAIGDNQPLELIYEKIQQYDKQEMRMANIQDTLVEIVAELTGSKESVLYPTGYPSIDKYLGGFTPGQLNIIAARPSVGKTFFSMNIFLKQIQAGHKVAFFSMEMTNKEIIQRILSRNSGMPVANMKKQANETQLKHIEQAMEMLDEQLKNLTLIDNISTLPGLLRSIRYLNKKEHVQIFYIDYLGLIEVKGDNKNLEISKITRNLKVLAAQLGVTIVLLSQLNRGIENRADPDPKLSDLRDSGAIEQDADVVLMLARDLEYDPTTLKVFVRKNRNWSPGEVELECKPASMQVGEKQNPF